MKPGIYFFFLLLWLGGKSQPLQTDCKPNGNSTRLGYQEVVTYTKNYHAIHISSLDNHTKALYINNNVILFLQRFFLHPDGKDYFGFCVYFLNYNNPKNPHQRKNTQSFLLIAPVKLNPAKNDTISDFTVLGKFYTKVKTEPEFKYQRKLNNAIICQGTCDSSLIKWTYNRPMAQDETRLHSAHLNEADFDSRLIFETNHKVGRKDYKDGQGAELNEKQTLRVYFDKLTINKLYTFLMDGNLTTFPGVGIYFGSYNSMAIKDQADPNQTMLGFAPMRKMISGYLEPDICTYVEYWNTKYHQNDKLALLAENHGTLCPNACPPGGK